MENLGMVTSQDEQRGLVKVYWRDVEKRIAKIEPNFARIVNEISPDQSFPIYLAYYPYGMHIGDTESLFIPKISGGTCRLSNPDLPKDVKADLGYGVNSAPLGMVLDKQLEFFMDLKPLGITIPHQVYSPGSMFAISRILNTKKSRVYAPNGVLSTTSGARSVFMLPHIGCATNHANLQRDFNIQLSAPKTLYDQWHLFNELVNSDVVSSQWRSCVAYFSEKWIEKLMNDSGWSALKLYMLESAWNAMEYDRNRIYYEVAFSTIQQTRNLKPNPYLADTARHLFATALGAVPGYIPATNNDSFPLHDIQNIFIESYGLKKYFPTIMQPDHFILEKDRYPVYYSLQHPAVQAFSPKSRRASSTLFEMRELKHIIRIFSEELTKPQGMCADTIMSKAATLVDFKYFHNEPDHHKVMMPSENITQFDDRFASLPPHHQAADAKIATDAKFMRGCVSISPQQ